MLKSLKYAALAVPLSICGLLLTANPSQAAAVAVNSCNTLSFSPTSPVTEGSNVSLTGTLTVQGTSNTCTATALAGRLEKFQWNTRTFTVDSTPVTEPVSCTYSAQFGETVGMLDVPDVRFTDNDNEGTTNASGQLTRSFITTDLGGKTIGFRARHDTENVGSPPNQTTYNAANSPCLDLAITESEIESVCPSNYTGAYVLATLATGNGTPPAPTTNGVWTYRISIYACGANIDVKTAQGGSNGWSDFVSYNPTVGAAELRDNGGAKSKKNEKTSNRTILWTLGNPRTILQNESEHIEVTVSGSIPASAPTGQLRCINGPWSAIYSADGGSTYQKSDYTGRVTLYVDNGDIDPLPNPLPTCN